MDHKTWLWKKKSTEKMIVATDKLNLSPKANEEEMHPLLIDKVELEKDPRSLNYKLSSALSDCDAKDSLVKKEARMVEEAMAGWEKAEAKAVSLKQELDEAIQQRAAGEERLIQLDTALKECMQQLRFVREVQEQRIHDAVMKASGEFEKSKIILEEKLAETSKRLAKIGVENTHLSKALKEKEKLIEDLTKLKAQMELDFNALMTRLESTEKDNASLKYEVRVLEKELEIRNEEREFNRRAAEASNKQQLESAKKIAKLESECQRLRLLVRKRLPGPAALAKMKSEVDTLGRDPVEMRSRRTNSGSGGLIIDHAFDNFPDTPSKKINFLTEHLYAMEEENRTLKEALKRKANEFQISRTMFAHTASKLSQVESHLDEMSKVQTTLEPLRSVLVPHDLSLASMSDVGSDDKVSCAESWASALISELEHVKQGKHRVSPSCNTIGASDINLMDDFVEMERLAIVSVDKQSGSLHAQSDYDNAAANPLETSLSGYSLPVTRIDKIQASNQEMKSKDVLIGKAPDWLQDILKVLLEKSHISQRQPYEILEDVRVALAETSNGGPGNGIDTRESSKHPSNSPQAGGSISLKPRDKSLLIDSTCITNDVDNLLTDGRIQQLPSDLGKSLHKIIEHVEGILSNYDGSETLSRKEDRFVQYKNKETSSGYMVRVFQWKTSELVTVLQQFVQACYGLLNGKSDVNRFFHDLSSTFDWIMNHCFSLQDVSSMREAVKKHLDWDESRIEGEEEAGMIDQISEVDKSGLPREHFSCLPGIAASNGLQNCLEKDENKGFRDELINIESTKKEFEGRRQSTTDKRESLTKQLQESENTIASLQAEVETLKISKAKIENQSENHKSMKEDLDTKLTVAKAELNEACQKFASLQVELENKNSCCEELETMCLELQLQLENGRKKAIPELHQEEKKLRTDWEITAASEKLAECQETILNLGKQLKALTAPTDTSPSDKVISCTSADTNATSVITTSSTVLTANKNKMMNQRSSLLDQMLAEDDAKTKDNKSPKFLILNGTQHQGHDAAVSSLAIVPSKNLGGRSLWRKLLWGKNKSKNKKPPLPFAP